MKKYLLSAILLTATIATAAPVKSVKEILTEQTKIAREKMYGKGGTAKGLNEASLKPAKDFIMKELKMTDSQSAMKINMALSGEGSATRMDSLVTVVAAKRLVSEISKTNADEAKAVDAAADATAKLIMNSALLGAKQESAIKDLNSAELKLVRESLTKMEEVAPNMIVSFNKTEREAFTKVLEKLDTLVDKAPNKSYEENFVQAIMETKGVSKEKALEIAKKLKECV